MQIIITVGLVVIGLIVSALASYSPIAADTHSQIILYTGITFTIVNGLFFQATKKLDDIENIQNLDIWHEKKLVQKIKYIRKILMIRWIIGFFCGTIGLIVGIYLKPHILPAGTTPSPFNPLVLFIGYPCVVLSGAYALLLMLAYKKLSDLLKDLKIKEKEHQNYDTQMRKIAESHRRA